MLNEKQRAQEVRMNDIRDEIRALQAKIERMKRENLEMMSQIKGDTDNQIQTI
jgi:TolA-binding protein